MRNKEKGLCLNPWLGQAGLIQHGERHRKKQALAGKDSEEPSVDDCFEAIPITCLRNVMDCRDDDGVLWKFERAEVVLVCEEF